MTIHYFVIFSNYDNEHVFLKKFENFQYVDISNIHYGILKLKGDNYKFWKEKVLLHVDWMNIDYVIRKLESLLLLRPTL